MVIHIPDYHLVSSEVLNSFSIEILRYASWALLAEVAAARRGGESESKRGAQGRRAGEARRLMSYGQKHPL